MNLADMKAMMAEVGVTVEVLSAEELAAALAETGQREDSTEGYL